MENISRVKQDTINWAHAKRLGDGEDLRHCENYLDHILNRTKLGFLDKATKDEFFSCEDRRRKILGEKQVAWRLKIRELLLTCGDENTKKNQDSVKGKKLSNTIWELNDDWGDLVSSFDDLDGLGVQHFGDLFTVLIGLSLAEIIRVAHIFPGFVDDNDNKRLMEAVTNNELLKILHSPKG